MNVERQISHYWTVEGRKVIERTAGGTYELSTSYGYTLERLLQLRAAIDAVQHDERKLARSNNGNGVTLENFNEEGGAT